MEISSYWGVITISQYCLVKVLVQEFADSEDDKDGDKALAQRLLNILYATEDGFAVPADGAAEEF